MRTQFVFRGLVSFALLALVACQESYPQQPKDPINADPKPQQPMNNPDPQTRGPGFQQDEKAGTAMNNPDVQQPTLQSPVNQEGMETPGPQKPFYGPGLKSPEEQAAAQAKAKAPLASDGEVISFLIAVNDGEVQMAEMAKKSADGAETKSFAAMMSTHHQQGLAKIRGVQTKTKIESKDNDLTTHAKNDASQNMSMLRDKKGKEFDRLYMDTQVRMHKDALDALDNRVIPAITNGELKTATNEMRRVVADHLSKAQDILKKLDPQTAAALSSDSASDATKGKSDTAVEPKKK